MYGVLQGPGYGGGMRVLLLGLAVGHGAGPAGLWPPERGGPGHAVPCDLIRQDELPGGKALQDSSAEVSPTSKGAMRSFFCSASGTWVAGMRA